VHDEVEDCHLERRSQLNGENAMSKIYVTSKKSLIQLRRRVRPITEVGRKDGEVYGDWLRVTSNAPRAFTSRLRAREVTSQRGRRRRRYAIADDLSWVYVPGRW
jgi:hypothetical protein